MTVRRRGLLAGALLLGFTCLLAGQRPEADPHELYERARDHLGNGELSSAAMAINRLRAMVRERPDWDPEHVFEKELLPPLVARLKRLQGVTRKLDAFTVRALADLEPPDVREDISTVRDYTAWTKDVIDRLRHERDQIISADLTDPDEASLITRTESYARTERLLETDILDRLAETAGDDIVGVLTGDPRLESVLVRFRQLKRDLIQDVAERDQMDQQLTKSKEQQDLLLRALAAVVTEGSSARAPAGARRSANVAEQFARFLDGELETLRERTSLTPGELAVLRANLARYRGYDRVLVAAGLASDQSEKIEALAQALDAAAVRAGMFPATPAAGWFYGILVGATVASAVSLAWLALERRRRRSTPRRAGEHRPSVRAGEGRGSGTDRDAA